MTNLMESYAELKRVTMEVRRWSEISLTENLPDAWKMEACDKLSSVAIELKAAIQKLKDDRKTLIDSLGKNQG